MRILFLYTRYRTNEYKPFAPNTLDNLNGPSGNMVCVTEDRFAGQQSIESLFSFNTEYFYKFVDENNVEFLDDFPTKDEKYVILYNLSDIISFTDEIKRWDEWYNKKDQVFLKMIDDLRNNRCSVIFRSYHDSLDDTNEISRDFVLEWLFNKDIPLNRISYLGCGVPNKANWWKGISSLRVHTICLQLYRILKGFTLNYYLSAFTNNLYHLRQKHFVTFNHHWKSGNRSKLVKFLSDNDYVKKGYVSYKASESSSSPNDPLKRIYLDSSEETHKELRGDITRHDNTNTLGNISVFLKKYNNRSLSMQELSSHTGLRSNSPLHFNSYFSIIVNFIAGNPIDKGIDLDEKMFRSIIHLQPFLIMGSTGILARLRKHGFKTFEPFIDESYDKEENVDKRMDMILNEVGRLCSMDRVEIDKWYWEMKVILLYNFNHFSKFCNNQMKLVMDEVERHWSLMHE